MRNLCRAITAALLLLVLGASLPASAQVNLRFDPPDTHLAVGEIGRMSIRLDEALEIRTIDVTVTYDTTIVRSVSGAAGALYTDSGIFTFDGFEIDEPGRWHGYAILMGPDLFVQGPGELYFWDFETLADGCTPVTSVEVYLSTTDGTWFEEVLLPPGKIWVGAATGIDESIPVVPGKLGLWPNPFNPRTRIEFALDAVGPVHLAVFDVHGRRVRTLLQGIQSAGPLTAEWDGRTATGEAAPGGVYFFRLVTPERTQTVKGVLIK